jgi:hypothetical protein
MHPSRSVTYSINLPGIWQKPAIGGVQAVGMCEGFPCFIRPRRPVQKIYALILMLGFVLAFGQGAKAQDEMNYAVQANILYHFTRYIDWPLSGKSGDFVIGVTGDTPLYAELQRTMKYKTAGGRKIVIRRISSSANSFDCHILFISKDESRNIKKILSTIADDSILLVSEKEGMARRGACINFVVVNDHLQLEINKNNITDRNLNIASELLQLGKIIN